MTTAAPHDLKPGEQVGEYEIVGVLGRGGFAAVYEGVQPVIGKRVAVKVLHGRHSSEDGVARFVHEARAVNKIAHDNIVDVFSFGQLPDGRPFFVMDLLRGMTLDRLIAERGRLPLVEALPILRGIALALDAAHARNIAHRDLKPENVFVAIDDHGTMIPKLLDFGLAKHLGAEMEGPQTQSGALIGTPAYMSPEQARGRSVDYRTDIYSFGIVAYEMLTGRVPFAGDDHLAVLVKHTTDEPSPPSSVAPELDGPTDRAILALLAKDPEARPKTLADAILALEGAASGSAGAARPPPAQASVESIEFGSAVAPAKPAAPLRWIIVAAVLFATAIIGAWLAARGSGEGSAAQLALRPTAVSRADLGSRAVLAAAAPPSAFPTGALPSVTSGGLPKVQPPPSVVPSARPKRAGSRPPQLDDVDDPFR